jgi:hypothetical protein
MQMQMLVYMVVANTTHQVEMLQLEIDYLSGNYIVMASMHSKRTVRQCCMMSSSLDHYTFVIVNCPMAVAVLRRAVRP